MTTTVNLTAQQAQSTIDPSTTLGVVVSWDFGFDGADCVAIPREQVADILRKHGFRPSEFIATPSDEHALVRAHRDVKWGVRCGLGNAVQIVRLKSEAGVPASFGVMVTKNEGVENANARTGARVRVKSSGGFAVAAPVDGDMDDDAEKVAIAIAEYAEKLSAFAFNQDLVALLQELRRKTGVVAMRRKGGGAYFIPAGKEADRFVAVLDDLEKATEACGAESRFYSHVTVLHADPRNVSTWSRNTTMTFDDELNKLADELKDMASRDNVRDSSWEKKKGECGSLMRRADRFAMLLEGQLDRIKSALGKLEGEFGTAQDQARQASAQAVSAFARINGHNPAQEQAQAKPKGKGDRALDALGAFRRVSNA